MMREKLGVTRTLPAAFAGAFFLDLVVERLDDHAGMVRMVHGSWFI